MNDPQFLQFLERRKRARAGGYSQPRNIRLAARIEQAIANREANRSAVDIERCLAICRACPDFTGDNCRDMHRDCKTKDRWIRALLILRGRPTHDCEQWRGDNDPFDLGLRDRRAC